MDFTLIEIDLRKRLEKFEKNAINYGVSCKGDKWVISKITPDEVNIIIDKIDNVRPALIIKNDTRKGYPFSFMFFDGYEEFELAEDSTTGMFKSLLRGLDLAADWIISNSL